MKRFEVADCNAAASGLENVGSFEILKDAARIASTHSKYSCKLLMSERDEKFAGMFDEIDQPFCGALLDGMRRVAGCRLK